MLHIAKQELISILCESMHFKKAELMKKTHDELLEIYNELYTGNDILFPNERDYDAEDENGI